MFTRFGIDIESPLELQRDFQFVRDWRKSSRLIKTRTIITAIGVLTIGGMGVLWLGVKMLLKQ